MAVSAWLTLREGLSVAREGDGGVVVEGRGGRLTFRPGHPAIAAALARLTPPGLDEEGAADAVLAAGGPEGLVAWYHAVDRLGRRRWLARSIRSSSVVLATLVPAPGTPGPEARPDPGAPGRRYRLSRFAYLRRQGDAMVLEAPTARARVIVHHPAVAAIIAALARASSLPELLERAGGRPPDEVAAVFGCLIESGLVGPAPDDEDGPITSPVEAWEFHDLLFHHRTRRGSDDGPIGATYRLAGRMEPPPPVRPVPPGDRFPLARPDLDRLREEDPPLSRVVEARRSERAYGPRPIDARQLGEFFYRVARARGEGAIEAETAAGAIRLATVSRPYPSGGALYELEFYAAVAACEGLEGGLYYYEPRGHALIRLGGPAPEVEGLLRDAAGSAGMSRASLQVLVILTARVPRIAWKYAAIAYSLILKHVGVVDHAMYLAATAMGLAPCALGAGDSGLFARAAGIDDHEETSVGEFLLGSRPTD